LKRMKAGFLALCLCAAPALASAQTMQWTDKGYASVNGGGQIASRTLSATSTFPLYGEDATIISTQKLKSSGLFDIGGAYRVWGNNLLAGLFFSHTSTSPSATLDGQIPDPRFFGQLRHVVASQGGVKHTENALHFDAIWMMPVAEKLDVGFFGGPSVFFAKHDTVSSLSVSEPGPSVSSSLRRVSKTTGGVNLGADAQYLVYKQWAAGATLRYTWGSARFDTGGKKTTLGGVQIEGGVRYRF
jgi:hypothetical protein